MTIVLTGGRVHTLVRGAETADALAYADGRIIAVGDREEVSRAAGPDAEVMDVAGAAILPGFIDAHHHVAVSALYGGRLPLVPPRVVDIASMQSVLAAAASDLPPGRFLVASAWDETLLRERRPPTRAELDDAVPDRPLFLLHHTCHRGLANSRALELAGIDAGTPEPAGGIISRGRGGVPDGLLIEQGMSRVEALARAELAKVDALGILDRIAAHQQALARVGITRVVDTAVPPDLLAILRESARRGDLIVPTHACPVSMKGWLEPPLDVLDGPRTGEGDETLTIGPVKLVFDGAPGCSMCLSWAQTLGVSFRSLALALRYGTFDPVRTSLSIEPRIGREIRTGIAIYHHAEAAKVVSAAVERGFAVATHAIGNAAIDVAISAYEATGASLGRAGVPRIEHAGFTDRALAKRMAGVGAAAVVQPAMLEMHMYENAPRIPGLPFFPLRWLTEASVRLVGSSDYPVHTFDPLVAMRTAVTRKNARSVIIDEEQRLTLDEALAMYTRNAAEVIGCDALCGTLERGKRADLVLVDDFSGALENARVRATIIGGRTVHGSPIA